MVTWWTYCRDDSRKEEKVMVSRIRKIEKVGGHCCGAELKRLQRYWKAKGYKVSKRKETTHIFGDPKMPKGYAVYIEK